MGLAQGVLHVETVGGLADERAQGLDDLDDASVKPGRLAVCHVDSADDPVAVAQWKDGDALVTRLHARAAEALQLLLARARDQLVGIIADERAAGGQVRLVLRLGAAADNADADALIPVQAQAVLLLPELPVEAAVTLVGNLPLVVCQANAHALAPAPAAQEIPDAVKVTLPRASRGEQM